MSDFLIYQTEDGKTQLSVVLDEELTEESVVRFLRTTAADGKSYEVAHYNLDMVLALGYRVRSQAGNRFRQWASAQLKEYIGKGLLANVQHFLSEKGPCFNASQLHCH